MHDSPYDDLLDRAIEAARGAGALVRDRRGAIGELRDKGLNDFVTEVDEDAQALIVECLCDGAPKIDVLAEEGADLDAAARANRRRARKRTWERTCERLLEVYADAE